MRCTKVFVAWISTCAFVFAFVSNAHAQPAKVVGLIPKAQKPVKIDGNLDDWEGAFVTPVHVGHPDYANRGAEFLFLWDEKNLYVGLRCLDQKPIHIGKDNQLPEGDSVEFYLDTRSGDQLGQKDFKEGTLHMFYTPLTGTEFKPRMQMRGPYFKDLKLKGARVAGKKTPWGYTVEFCLPWENFPKFSPKNGVEIGIDCELCSSDGKFRVDRTFVYSSPKSVFTPAAFGRVRLVDKLDTANLANYSRALMPASLAKSANFGCLYGTVCVSPSLEKSVAKLEGAIINGDKKVVKKMNFSRKKVKDSDFHLWRGSCEIFDLPAGIYTVQIKAVDEKNALLAFRTIAIAHGRAPAPK